MKNFFYRRFFIIALIVAVVLALAASVLSALGITGPLRSVTALIASPFQSAFMYAANAIEGFTAYFSEFDRLAEENTRLRAMLAGLQDQLYNEALLEDENAWLRGYLGVKREHIDYELEPAEIIGRETGNYATVFTINRGSTHGVERDMPVITEDGIIGHVSEVGLTWAKVVTIIETAEAIGAYVERSGQIGLVEGDFYLRRDGVCILNYLPIESDITIGDRVFSSGLGPVYPRGLLIGEVVELIADEYSRTMTARIKPSADLAELRRVMVVKGYEIYLE